MHTQTERNTLSIEKPSGLLCITLTKMPCWKVLFLLFFIPLLLIFLISPSTVSSYSLDVKVSSSVKVNLSVYYETLCPSCANFIVKNLMSIFNDGLFDIINLRMVPWGNAHMNRVNNTIVCQVRLHLLHPFFFFFQLVICQPSWVDLIKTQNATIRIYMVHVMSNLEKIF